MLEYAMFMSVATSLQFIYSPAAATAVVKRTRIDSSFICFKLLINVVTLQVIFDFKVVHQAFKNSAGVQVVASTELEPSHLNPIFIEDLCTAVSVRKRKNNGTI